MREFNTSRVGILQTTVLSKVTFLEFIRKERVNINYSFILLLYDILANKHCFFIENK